MKRVFLLLVFCSVCAHAETMKIAMDGEVKQAKEIGTGKGVTFTLPELESNDFFIYAAELAVFEKRNGETSWHIYKDENTLKNLTIIHT